MNEAEKRQFLRQYLQSRSADREVAIDDAALDGYQPILDRIHLIERENPVFFARMTADPGRSPLLETILNSACNFDEGSPPVLRAIDDARLRMATRELELTTLPGCDYYARETTSPPDAALNDLIVASREKLRPIIESFAPGLNVANNEAVLAKIKEVEGRVKAAAAGSPEKALAEKQLTILQDLNKINRLTLMEIPQEGAPPRQYCVLAEAAAGVTEKVSLVPRGRPDRPDERSVDAQLRRLIAADDVTTLDQYHARRSGRPGPEGDTGFKLSMQAIIKLPKHGEVKEVQREAMALNVSRLLGLDTTDSTMVTHGGRPGLFVPFADIRLLNEVARGKTMQARLGSRGEYSHYSTINSVGAGLQANQFVEDFGNSLGLFYLCSDTDAIGGYNQNKALRGNHLFIFDQVIMADDKLGLDSRMSMQPISFITKHTRHDQGRNRTLIEDSSMDSKFASLMQLKAEQEKLLAYFTQVAAVHQHKMEDLREQLNRPGLDREARKGLEAQLKEVRLLRDDAVTLQTKVAERIRKIDDIFPRRDAGVGTELLKNTLVLEKLVNNPKLFAEDKRAYRNPWVNRNENRITNIASQPGGQYLVVTFKSAIPDDMLAMIRRNTHSGHSPIRRSDKEMYILIEDLQRLTESALLPEHHLQLNAATNYLDVRDLQVIQRAYDEGHRTRIIAAVQSYQDEMARLRATGANPREVCRLMSETEATLKGFIDPEKDQGFAMHVLKKFQFDQQQQLQRLMPAEQRPQINEAFSAALKLDRVEEFNAVVREAVKHDRLADGVFTAFLQRCMDDEAMASAAPSAHFRAIELSRGLQEAATAAIVQLQQPVVREAVVLPVAPEPVAPVVAVLREEDELAGIDPLEDQDDMQHREAEIFNESDRVFAHLGAAAVDEHTTEESQQQTVTVGGVG
ncbi:hypothetical protein [Legionella oakridgensis]|uniref:hypothetical protein n=1 Tax=Legionella oakridgensis TaxID=29423 RepID=UPI0003DE5937|nr:hypothetical protein [Legionella oakridgensis]ETO92634.1 hypothetical protein LOR_47c08260 [Legionella oakridgensis RV-2-2007]